MRPLLPVRLRGETAVGPRAEGGLDGEVGSVAQRPNQLRHALWSAHTLLEGSAKADKRVLIFTGDPNPPGTGAAAAEFRRAPKPERWRMAVTPERQSSGGWAWWELCDAHLLAA